MKEKSQQNKKEKEPCPLCKISEETISQLKKSGKDADLYQCPECGFLYKEKEWAEKCQVWCKEHKSCNLEITQHAVKRSKKLNF